MTDENLDRSLKQQLQDIMVRVHGAEDAARTLIGKMAQKSAGDSLSQLAANISGTYPNAGVANLVGNTFGNGLSGLTDTASRIAAMAGPLGQVISGFIELTKTTAGLISAQVEGSRNLGRYSGNTAVAYAQLDIGRTFREIDMARGTSASLAALVDQQNKMEKNLLGLQIWFENAKNNTLSGFMEAFNDPEQFFKDVSAASGKKNFWEKLRDAMFPALGMAKDAGQEMASRHQEEILKHGLGVQIRNIAGSFHPPKLPAMDSPPPRHYHERNRHGD